MKKVRRYNIILLLLMALCGILLGFGATMLILSLQDKRAVYSFCGLICTILAAGLALALPFLTMHRDNLVARVDKLMEAFGRETNFLDEKAFLKEVAKRRPVPCIYALHLELTQGISELKRKEVGYALSEGVETVFNADAIIGYDKGDFFFFTFLDESEFVESAKKVEQMLLSNKDLPILALLMGVSKSKEGYPQMIEEAIFAARFAAERRDSLTIQPYEPAEKEKDIDLAKEEEMGRLSYFSSPFGDGEERVSVLSPVLYDSFRGNLEDKDLLRAMTLFKARKELDKACLLRAVTYLQEKDAIGSMMVRIGEESAQNPLLLSEIAAKMAEASIEPARLILAFNVLELDKKNVKYTIAKAKSLGLRLGIYEFGGSGVETLIGQGFEYALIKPELLRTSADPDFLADVTNVLYALRISPLIEKGKLGEGLSALPPRDVFRLIDLEEVETMKKEDDAK